jgi:hypothetical protein
VAELGKLEKVKVIANVHHAQGTDKRSLSDIQLHMKTWAMKGYLSDDFINGCYAAIENDQPVMIEYKPGKHYMYLTSKK